MSWSRAARSIRYCLAAPTGAIKLKRWSRKGVGTRYMTPVAIKGCPSFRDSDILLDPFGLGEGRPRSVADDPAHEGSLGQIVDRQGPSRSAADHIGRDQVTRFDRAE